MSRPALGAAEKVDAYRVIPSLERWRWSDPFFIAVGKGSLGLAPHAVHAAVGAAHAMTTVVDPGSVVIEVEVANRRVRSVRIASTRPSHVARLFVGRLTDEIPPLAERLFSLCGRSHGVAAARAAAVALDRPITQSRRTADAIGLAAERIAETLRGTALGGLAANPATVEPEVAMQLREALSVARTLVMHGLSNGKQSAAQSPALVNRLAQAMHRLGVPAGPDGAPAPNTPIGRFLKEAETETAFLARSPDMLSEADDLDVIEALRAQGESFAAAPALPGRVAETGAYARHWQHTAMAPTALAARLCARLLDMIECLDLLKAAVTTGVTAQADPVRAERTGPNEGFAALESPRGRLYHWLRLNAVREVTACAIVAPTEWNFHPRGPLVEALRGAPIGSGEDARRRVSRLVAVFDPCVSFEVRVAEAASA